MSEARIQQDLFTWIDTVKGQYPVLGFVYHVPNGRKRSKVDAAMLEREGVRPGVWDIRFDGPRLGFAGFAGELKDGYNGLEEAQKRWLCFYRDENIYCCVHYDWVSMARELLTYLSLPAYLKGGLILDPNFSGPARGRAQIARALADLDQPADDAGGNGGVVSLVPHDSRPDGRPARTTYLFGGRAFGHARQAGATPARPARRA